MSFWWPFLDSYPTIHHTNIGVRLRSGSEIGTSILHIVGVVRSMYAVLELSASQGALGVQTQGKTGDYHIQVYLSSNIKVLNPYRFVADSSQMTWTRQSWGFLS